MRNLSRGLGGLYSLVSPPPFQRATKFTARGGRDRVGGLRMKKKRHRKNSVLMRGLY